MPESFCIYACASGCDIDVGSGHLIATAEVPVRGIQELFYGCLLRSVLIPECIAVVLVCNDPSGSEAESENNNYSFDGQADERLLSILPACRPFPLTASLVSR